MSTPDLNALLNAQAAVVGLSPAEALTRELAAKLTTINQQIDLMTKRRDQLVAQLAIVAKGTAS